MKLSDYLIASVFVVLSHFSIAQEVKMGSPIKLRPMSGETINLGWHDGFLYTLEKGTETTNIGITKLLRPKIRLEKVSKDFKLVFSKELKYDQFKESYFYNALVKDGELRIFFVLNKKREKNSLQYLKFDLEGNFRSIQTVMTFDEDNYINKVYPGGRLNYLKKISFSISPNDLKVAMTSVCLAKDNKEFEITTVVSNSDGSNVKVHKNSFLVEKKVFNFYYGQFVIDDFGNSIINYTVVESSPRAYTRKLLIIANDGKVLAHKKMGKTTDSLFYHSIDIKLTKENDIYMAGVAKGSEFGKSIFFTKLEFDKLNDSLLKVPLYMKYHSSFDRYHKHSDGFNFDIELDKDGGGFLVLNIVHTASYSASSVGNGGVIRRNDGVYVFPFNSDLKLGEYVTVPRRVKSFDKNYTLIHSLVSKGELVMIYNDHENNINFDESEQMEVLEGRKKMSTYLARIGHDNSLSRKILLSNKEVPGDFDFRNTESIEGVFFRLFHYRRMSDYSIMRYGEIKL